MRTCEITSLPFLQTLKLTYAKPFPAYFITIIFYLKVTFHVVKCTFHVVVYIFHVVKCTFHDVKSKTHLFKTSLGTSWKRFDM